MRWRRACAWRRASAFGVVAGTLLGAITGYSALMQPAARSDAAGAARDPLDRLGAAVHSVVRHLRGLEDHADRGRRVLPGLSRRHGRDHVGRPQARRGRPRLPAFGRRDGAAHSVACGAAGLCAVVALRARAWLDVRGRRRTDGRLRRARLSADRRPAARQAGADRRRHRRIRHHRQDHRLDHRRRRRAVPALGGRLCASRKPECSASNASAKPIRTACVRSTPLRLASSRARSLR